MILWGSGSSVGLKDDIYRIRDKICEQKEWKILKQKDFCGAPKKKRISKSASDHKDSGSYCKEGMREMKVESNT